MSNDAAGIGRAYPLIYGRELPLLHSDEIQHRLLDDP